MADNTFQETLQAIRDQVTELQNLQATASQGIPALRSLHVTQDEWIRSLKDAERALDAQRSALLKNNALQIVGAGAGAPGAAYTATGGLSKLTAASAALGQIDATGAGAMTAIGHSIGTFIPVVGAATGVVVAVTGAVTVWQTALRNIQPTIEEATSNLQRSQTALQAGRQTGLASRDPFREAFTGTSVLADMELAQRLNHPEQQRAIMRRVQTRAQADVERFNAATPGGGAASEFLTQQMLDYRRSSPLERGGMSRQMDPDTFLQTGGRAGQGAGLLRNLWTRAGNRIEDMPEELRHVDLSTLTETRIAELSRSFDAAAVRARAQLQQSTVALGPGGLPNLQPGAPQLADLPNLFRSQQGDVLDLHAQVQQDLVRDQREEAQFQQQFTLFEQILAGILALNSNTVGVDVDATVI